MIKMLVKRVTEATDGSKKRLNEALESFKNYFGVVAQLGERLNGIQEAKSSILFSSTRISRVYGLGRKPFFCIWGFSVRFTMLHVSVELFSFPLYRV